MKIFTTKNHLNLAFKAMFVFASCLMLTCCTDPLSQTQEEDTTMLWPAADNTGFWGFINEKGEMVIPAKYDRTYGFCGGKALVVIDVDGEPARSNIGYQASIFGWHYAFIDTKGNILYSFPEECAPIDHYFYYGCCRVECKRVQGVIDSKFNYVIPLNDRNYGIQLGIMTKDGLASSTIGYFNKKGEIAISRYINGVDGELYFHLYDFCDGIAVVNKWWYDDSGWSYNRNGAINTKGELVIDTIYRELKSVGNDRLLYKLEDDDSGCWDCWGLMDTRGNIITKQSIREYGDSFYGDGGLMPVRGDGGVGYIDKNGDLQIPYQYTDATPFCEGKAWVLVPNGGGYKLINLQGEVLLSLDPWWEIPVTLFPANGAHNGLCLIRNDKEQSSYKYTYKYINLQGEVVYSWVVDDSSRHSGAPKRIEQAEQPEEDRLLQMFEGTKYYPLASQCVQRRKAHLATPVER